MADITVGTEECPILDAWSVLSNSFIIKEKWTDFAGYLRIPSEDIEKLRLDLLHDKISRNDIIKKILLLWVADQGSNAKLAELIRVIEEECGDNSAGEQLWRAKNLPRKNFQNISTNLMILSSALQENVEQNISKFCPQIPNGNEYCSMHDVWTVLSKSEIIKEKWSDFAGFLRIPVEDIERLRHALLLDKINPNYVLIQVLIFWVGHQAGNAQLTELIRVVEDECFDNAVGEKLRLAHNLPCKNFLSDKTTWELLALAFQEKVVKSISDFFPNIPIHSVKSKLQGDVLLDLMTGRKPNIFKSILPPSPAFYLKRTLLPRHTISEKVFEEAAPDIFLFTGLNEFELGKLVKTHDTSTSDEQLDSSEIHVRFLILKLKNHFEKICNKAKAGTPVHLLLYDKISGKLKWVKSHGSVKLLQRFVEERQNPLTEKQLLGSLENAENGPVIISDGPGMGKSFLLANIALKLQNPGDKIVVFMSVNDFIKQVQLNSGYDQTTQDSITVTLQNLICQNELGALDFSDLLSASDIKIELLLDGFDEVSMAETALALDKIKVINESFKSIRLWITTRPHYLEELEDKLGVLGYNIKGLDEEDQVHFLVSQWQHSKTGQDDVLDKDKLELYAHKVLRTTKSKLNKDDNDIAGAPLQCLLIGEVYEEDCIAFASGNGDSESLPTIRINSISNLYESMITKKFKKYIQTHVTTEFAGMDNLILAHVDLSIKRLFYAYHPQLDYIQVDIKDLLNIGIIQASSSADNTNFIHRTFAEYFVAGYVVEKLSKEEIEKSEFSSFFLEEILTRKQHLFHILPGTPAITSYRFVHQIISYFINDCISQSVAIPSNLRFAIEEPRTRMEISHACANSSFLQILKLFLVSEHSNLDETLILLAIRNSTFEYFTFIISSFGESLASFEEKQLSNFLRAAVLRSEPSMVKYLIRRPAFSELIENVNDSTKLLLHDCISNTKYKPQDDIEKRLGVIQHLVEISPNLLEEKDENGRTPLLCEHAHVNLLKELIRLGAEISSQDNMGNTVLHLSHDQTRRFNAHEYNSFLNCIPIHQLAKVLSTTNNEEETLLERLLYYIDPTEETLQILFQNETDSIQELFEMAIANGRNSQTLKILIKHGLDISWRNKRGASYLHQASLYGNVEALKLLIEEYSFDVNIKDYLMSTPIDYAILSDVSDSNRYETAKILHSYGGRASEQPQLALNQAIKDGNTESVRIIQEILKFGNEPFVESVSRVSELKGSHLSVDQYNLLVKDFVGKNKSFRDSDGSSLLHVAAHEGDELAVKELVENGADLNDRDLYGNTPIHNACFCNDLDIGLRIIKFLIDSGADAYAMDENNHTFVSRLVARRPPINPEQFHEIAEYLIGNNLSNLLASTPEGPRGSSPLQLACQELELEERTINLLKHNNISINYVDGEGQNALISSIQGGRSKVFLSLLVNECNADWKLQDINGDNALHVAARFGHLDAMKLLIHLGLDVNQINSFGNTPLHRIAEFGTKNVLEAARILVEAGMDVNKKDNVGNTAFDLVQKRKGENGFENEVRFEFIKLLKIGKSEASNNIPIAFRNDSDLSLESAGQVPELLHKIVIENDDIDDCLKLLKSLILPGTDVLEKDQNGHTFLYKFVSSNKLLPSQFHDISNHLLDTGHQSLFETQDADGATSLHLAIQHLEPQLETLHLFKSHKMNFNRLDSKGNSLLVYAIMGHRTSEFLSLLINEFGVGWRRLNNYKQNLIHTSVREGNRDALLFFLNLGLNINARDMHGSIPIHLASTGLAGVNILEMLNLLVENGADVNAKNNRGLTPLHCTVVSKEQSSILPVVKFLIERGADPFAVNESGWTFLHLLTLDVNDICPITPVTFHQLAEYLSASSLFELFHISSGEFGSSPAHHAVENLELHEDTLGLLFPHKSYINNADGRGCSILSYAIIGKRSRKFCQALIDLGADINLKTSDDYGQSLLHISARHGLPELVELLIDLGLDVNISDNLEQTPLHDAVCRQDSDVAIEIINCLVKNRANPNALDSSGSSPLYFAVRSNQNLSLINCLLNNGANVNSLNFHNTSYIHLAAQYGEVQILKFFLDMKVLDVNGIDNDGDTPLHCVMGQEESDYVLEKVQLLMEYGADARIMNKKGETAFVIADARTDWDDEVINTLKGLFLSVL